MEEQIDDLRKQITDLQWHVKALESVVSALLDLERMRTEIEAGEYTVLSPERGLELSEQLEKMRPL